MGEGSSREHAAMEPRFRNGKVILARSFARIPETNLKKQGLLPLAFPARAVLDPIRQDDRLPVPALRTLAPSAPFRYPIPKPHGTTNSSEGPPSFNPTKNT